MHEENINLKNIVDLWHINEVMQCGSGNTGKQVRENESSEELCPYTWARVFWILLVILPSIKKCLVLLIPLPSHTHCIWGSVTDNNKAFLWGKCTAQGVKERNMS